jgi:hypothetical protein
MPTIVLGDGLIYRERSPLQDQGVRREPAIGAETVIDGEPCVGNAGRARIRVLLPSSVSRYDIRVIDDVPACHM